MPTDPIGVTLTVPATADAMPVRNEPDAADAAFVVDAPYLLSDGRSLEAPIPVVVVDATSWVDPAGNLRDVQPLNISGLLPTLTVTGGTITPFSREGVDYVEVLWQSSGGFTLSAAIPTHRRALGAGGGTGGRSTGTTYLPGAGGAGGLDKAIDVPLLAGSYTVTIGAGGAAITAGVTSNSGSNSVLTNVTTSVSVTAIGGGYGAISGAFAAAANGGSGGGARAATTADGTDTRSGLGTTGQGNIGGSAHNSTTPANAAAGGSGGAGGGGGNAAAGVAGAAGSGKFLDWLATPMTVCAGERGLMLADDGAASVDKTYGAGSRGALNAAVGKGGDGFMFIRVRAADVNVVMA